MADRHKIVDAVSSNRLLVELQDAVANERSSSLLTHAHVDQAGGVSGNTSKTSKHQTNNDDLIDNEDQNDLDGNDYFFKK